MKKILLSTFYFLFSTTVVFAQVGGEGGEFELPNPLQTTSVADLLARIINFLIIYIGPPIFTLMILYGAFQILTAGGDPEKFKTGKKTILYAVIGYAILLVAGGVGFLIKQLLEVR